jgi:transglutaminase-like putative cysteine protease
MKRPLAPRSTLWLIASLVLVAAPHAERVPWWLTLLTATLIAWRLYLSRVRLPLPHRAVLFLIVVGATAGVYLHYGVLFGRDAGVALLVVMLTLKVLETRTVRDGMLLIFLAYFLVITNFLYSQTIPTALYMLVCVWIITASMIGLQYATPPRGYGHQLRTAGALLVQSIPLMLVFFVLFPRVQGPLWGMPADALRATSGLSDTMSPGSLAELTLSEAVAFRAVFKSRMPPVNRLYWRGLVLWDFDGRSWHAPRVVRGQPQYQTTNSPVEYSVTVEAHGKAWLFALDLPGKIPPGAFATRDMQLLALQPVTSRRRYDMVSFLDYRYGAQDPPEVLQRALQIPPGFNPRAVAYARELRGRYPRDRDLVTELLRRFNQDGYVYTLSPPLLGEHTVDDFLFGAKSGFCEHYASAFAFVLRAAGIPARVVTGYLGGEMNPIGDYLIVRQADAHAWTEVWLKQEGWVRFDPTAAVAPARIEQGIGAAIAGTSTLPLFMRGDFAVLRELRLTWDSLANSWNQWVLGYTPERQRALLTRVGLDDATWRTLAVLLLIITGAFTLVLAIVTLRRLRVRVSDPVKLAYGAFCEKLKSRGIARRPEEGPAAYAERVSGMRPDLEPVVHGFIALYIALRYAGAQGGHEVGRLQQLAREFNP